MAGIVERPDGDALRRGRLEGHLVAKAARLSGGKSLTNVMRGRFAMELGAGAGGTSIHSDHPQKEQIDEHQTVEDDAHHGRDCRPTPVPEHRRPRRQVPRARGPARGGSWSGSKAEVPRRAAPCHDELGRLADQGAGFADGPIDCRRSGVGEPPAPPPPESSARTVQVLVLLRAPPAHAGECRSCHRAGSSP